MVKAPPPAVESNSLSLSVDACASIAAASPSPNRDLALDLDGENMANDVDNKMGDDVDEDGESEELGSSDKENVDPLRSALMNRMKERKKARDSIGSACQEKVTSVAGGQRRTLLRARSSDRRPPQCPPQYVEARLAEVEAGDRAMIMSPISFPPEPNAGSKKRAKSIPNPVAAAVAEVKTILYPRQSPLPPKPFTEEEIRRSGSPSPSPSSPDIGKAGEVNCALSAAADAAFERSPNGRGEEAEARGGNRSGRRLNFRAESANGNGGNEQVEVDEKSVVVVPPNGPTVDGDTATETAMEAKAGEGSDSDQESSVWAMCNNYGGATEAPSPSSRSPSEDDIMSEEEDVEHDGDGNGPPPS